MMSAVIWLLVSVCGAAVWAAAWYMAEAHLMRKDLTRTTAHMEDRFTELRVMYREQFALVREQLTDARTAHAAEIEHMTRGSAYGTISTPDAQVVPARPDAEQRLQRRVQAETIAAGAQAIKAEYAAAGLMLTDEEAQDQATSMLLGMTPTA